MIVAWMANNRLAVALALACVALLAVCGLLFVGRADALSRQAQAERDFATYRAAAERAAREASDKHRETEREVQAALGTIANNYAEKDRGNEALRSALLRDFPGGRLLDKSAGRGAGDGSVPAVPGSSQAGACEDRLRGAREAAEGVIAEARASVDAMIDGRKLQADMDMAWSALLACQRLTAPSSGPP